MTLRCQQHVVNGYGMCCVISEENCRPRPPQCQIPSRFPTASTWNLEVSSHTFLNLSGKASLLLPNFEFCLFHCVNYKRW